MRRPHPRHQHPWWCARAHHCAADRGGRHRSAPLSTRIRGAVVTVTRTRAATGRGGLEIRTRIDLPADETAAQQHAARMAARILTSITR